jgi:outer membrane protein assembly factor BamB
MTLRSLLLLSFVTTSLFAAEPEWNQFRGGRGDGTSKAEGIPTAWSETKNVRWKTEIWGKGWSSPVTWKDRIWLTTGTEDGHRLAVMCLDRKTGKILHDKTIFEHEKPQYCHPFNSYASPTPWIEDGRLYITFGALGTACLDSETLRVIWKREDLECNHWRGPGSSVSIYGNLLYLPFDGHDHQFVMAFDKRNGKTVWRKDRNVDYKSDNGDIKKAYGTARVITFKGRTQVIVPGAMATMAYEPNSGKELWRVIHGGMNACIPPLFSDGKLYITTSSPSKLLAVRPDGIGDVTKTHVEWTARTGVPARPSQLLVGDSMFMVDNSGVASCIDTATGKPRWTKRIAGKFTASPVLVGDRIYCFQREMGKSHVFAADPKKYRELATNTLDAGCMASPAVTNGLLILRTKTHLYGIGE